MKKINLFNKTISPLSSGKGCPVERGGVWELPRRTPCATPSWEEGERSGRGGLWFAALVALFVATPSFATPTELDKKTVASKAYVDTKQDIIETGLVEFDDLGTTAAVPALVLTNAAGTALNGNTIGFLDLNTYYDLNSGLDELPDTMVPSIGLLNNKLQDIWNEMPYWTALTWNSAETTSTNAYETKFVGDTGATANAWPSADKTKLINTAALAQGLALKQNKLPAKSTGNAAPKGNQAVVLNTAGNPSNVYTTAGKDLALTAKSGAEKVMNYIDGTTTLSTFATNQGLTQAQVKSALVSLELLKDVYSELNTKITNNALPTGTTGTVVTYNGTNATTGVQEFGERAVYDPANAYNAQNDATKLATAGFVETKQNKMVCAGWDSDTHTDEHCWLWSIE